MAPTDEGRSEDIKTSILSSFTPTAREEPRAATTRWFDAAAGWRSRVRVVDTAAVVVAVAVVVVVASMMSGRTEGAQRNLHLRRRRRHHQYRDGRTESGSWDSTFVVFVVVAEGEDSRAGAV